MDTGQGVTIMSEQLPSKEQVSEKLSVDGALDMAARCRYLDNGPACYDRTLYGAVWALADEVLRLRAALATPTAAMLAEILCCLEPREPGWHSLHVIEGRCDRFWSALSNAFADRPPAPETLASPLCDGEVRVIYEHGEPHGVRDVSGYLCHFNRVPKFEGQEERYRRELALRARQAEAIATALRGTQAAVEAITDIKNAEIKRLQDLLMTRSSVPVEEICTPRVALKASEHLDPLCNCPVDSWGIVRCQEDSGIVRCRAEVNAENGLSAPSENTDGQ